MTKVILTRVGMLGESRLTANAYPCALGVFSPGAGHPVIALRLRY